MLTTYTSRTLVPNDFETDWNLGNSYGNTFIDCTFEGTFTDFNFTRALFHPDCTFTGATFRGCNFTAINPEGSDADSPTLEASAATSNNVTTVIPPGLEAGITGDENTTLTEQKSSGSHAPAEF